MTGGELLVACLVREGVRVVFGLPGVQLYGLVAALRDEPWIRFVTTRHEQATTYMADGYARAGGGFGTALVVPGPGLLNAAAGLATAYAASSPVLLVSGQVPRDWIGRGVGVLHEVDDQLEAIAPLTKWRARILDGGEIPATVREAVAHLTDGRPRPVAIELPPDVLREEVAGEPLEPRPPARLPPAARALDEAADLLLAATRPVLVAGGGVHASGAHGPLAALAAHLQAGVIQTDEGKGAVSDADDISLGAALWSYGPLREHLESCDLVLAVGTRLAEAALPPGRRVVQIDVDESVIGLTHPGALPLVGDARATLEELLARVRHDSPPRASRAAERQDVRARVAALATEQPQAAVLASLRAGTPRDAVVVADMTQIGYYARAFWPVYEPRTYLTSSYSGNLGYAYPTALGAKVAVPDRPVVSISGDGGFLYNTQELATAVQHGIAVVAVVFDDGAYGNVARDLDEDWGGSFAADLHNPDFAKLADAYGALALRAGTPTDVGGLVAEALEAGRPSVVWVPVPPMPKPAFFPQTPTAARYRSSI